MLADMNAFNREYENDNSWEQLEEDEYGHLRPLVRKQAASCSIIQHNYVNLTMIGTAHDK